MAQSPVTVTYSLEDVLGQINHKLDDLQKDVTNLRVGQAEIKTELTTLKEDVKDIKGSQKAQIWTLIGISTKRILGDMMLCLML